MVFISTTLKSVLKYFKKKAVSSLDEESKWSVHYTAPWRQQENVFLPSNRPPCVEELHLQAKVNLKTVLRECDKLRKDGFRSSQYYSQGPTFSSPILSDGSLEQDENDKKKKSSEMSGEEEKLVYSMRPQTPLLDICDMNTQSCWSQSLPLPTPEEKMRQQAQNVATDIVPINITGESFDRQASFRRTIINTDTVIRRSKKVKRRKTITGVPDNIQSELATKEQTDIRTNSMYMPGQYSTLGHGGTAGSPLKPSDTCESGSQTEEVKIVPPSMRRIRAQRGQGIAAQMANISLTSSGSISTMSDCNGAIYTCQRNGSDQGFHSLPRQGARISLQQHDPMYVISPYNMMNGSASSLPHQVNMPHTSTPSKHILSNSRKSPLVSPKFDEFRGFQDGPHKVTPGYIGSPASFDRSGAIQNSSDFSSVQSTQTFETEETSLQSVSSCSSNQPFTTSGTSFSTDSSRCQSPASLNTNNHTETESQCSTLDGLNGSSPRGVRRDSDFSESSTQSCSTLTTDQWTYEAAPKGQHTHSSCSSPVCHTYSSLEHSPSKTDSSSLFSVDNDGYYTSMHLDSGLKSHSHGCINKAGHMRHNMYESRERHNHGDSVSLHSNQSLTRSISLRKSKKPPLPPKRTDSLVRKSHRKAHHSETVLNEQLISSLQKSLKNHSASFSGQIHCNGFEDPWVLRPRSQSTVSAASSGMSAPAAVCPVTPTHSDCSSQRSEYAESWDFYMDFSRSHSEQGPSSPTARSVNATENAEGVPKHNGFPSVDCNTTAVKSKVTTSPDKIHHVTSPSSGYSSQSITPTAGTPVTSLIRGKSPAGRPKPKVPERKSSLRSSVSSSSTSLSSNTSDSIKTLPTPPPQPSSMPIFPLQQPSESISTTQTETKIMPIPPPPPPPLPKSPTTKKKQNSPPPSSEASDLKENMVRSLPAPPPPPPLPFTKISCVHTPPPPPPLPGMGLQAVTILKTELSPTCVEEAESPEESNSKESEFEEPEKPQRPLITPQALQMVQLRPIKLMKLENIFTDIITTVCDADPYKKCRNSVETKTLESVFTPASGKSPQNEMGTSESQVADFVQDLLVFRPTSTLSEPVNTPEMEENDPEFAACSELFNIVSQNALQKQKPPISPKKPNLSLIIPPFMPQQLQDHLKFIDVSSPEVSTKPEAVNCTSLIDTVNLEEIPSQQDVELDSESEISSPVAPKRFSLSSEFSSDSLNDPQSHPTLIFKDLGLSDNDLGLSDKDLELSDDKELSDDASSSSGSISFREEDTEDNGAGFDSSTESSSPTSSTNGESAEEILTPTRPRTTEDLFAAIHRSKRKVLGRGDSEDERCRGIFPSPPDTPTDNPPSLPPTPRQLGTIHRSLRRSSTSNDSFKALLLRKGSRSEFGFRMSAAEMLKCTDPRLQRAAMDSPQADAPCVSPGRSRRVSEDWARIEGALPRLSPILSSSKYKRSSTPPSAASSRYNSRSHILSGPMTVICEREGELAETTDSCLSGEVPFPLSLTSSGMVCAQGST